ncbi:MAG: hypothetical protein ISR96_10835 [Nitrospira sp.]|nr:hypothetical protein [bacterium]MBL7049999.1 hypothetical protein [Nitrospira sp.]
MPEARFDSKETALRDIFLQLKDILVTKLGKEVDIEIMVYTPGEAKKVKTFASMSGCRIEIDKLESYYIIHITGSPCCV